MKQTTKPNFHGGWVLPVKFERFVAVSFWAVSLGFSKKLEKPCSGEWR